MKSPISRLAQSLTTGFIFGMDAEKWDHVFKIKNEELEWRQEALDNQEAIEKIIAERCERMDKDQENAGWPVYIYDRFCRARGSYESEESAVRGALCYLFKEKENEGN